MLLLRIAIGDRAGRCSEVGDRVLGRGHVGHLLDVGARLLRDGNAAFALRSLGVVKRHEHVRGRKLRWLLEWVWIGMLCLRGGRWAGKRDVRVERVLLARDL